MVTIRKAKQGDAAEIANVHLNAWREAYHALLPQAFLDQLPLSFKRRMDWWTKTIEEARHFLYVAEAELGIVGFSCFGSPRDVQLQDCGELGAIYLLEKFKGQGTGAGLLKSGFTDFSKKGIQRAYCWVLENNPTIRFYEKMGALPNGMTKQVELGGSSFTEFCYVWQDLKMFSSGN